MYSYFKKYDRDAEFYEKHLKAALPRRIVDAHAHYNLPEHVKNITPETIAGDWALECGLLMSYEDSRAYYSAFFPDADISSVLLPWPLRDADTAANNAYISKLIAEKGERGLFTVRPEYDTEYIRCAFAAGHFSGFKPYPYMASAQKGAEVSIFDFMPRAQWALANELHAPVLLHLPRAGRLPDPGNISELREILNSYPDIKLVVAHFGRCFCHEHFERALDLLGEDADRLWFDTAAVLNPKVYRIAAQRLDYKKILFGTDLPIMLWHGRREWTEGKYINLCAEDFSWNAHRYPNEEGDYVFFVYEQLKNLLDAFSGDREALSAIFRDNALSVYGKR